MMESIANWYSSTLGSWLPKEVFVFFVSMVPFIELRGGLPIASMLGIPIVKANILCIVGNLVPIPFILLFKKADVITMFCKLIAEVTKSRSREGELGEWAFR